MAQCSYIWNVYVHNKLKAQFSNHVHYTFKKEHIIDPICVRCITYQENMCISVSSERRFSRFYAGFEEQLGTQWQECHATRTWYYHSCLLVPGMVLSALNSITTCVWYSLYFCLNNTPSIASFKYILQRLNVFELRTNAYWITVPFFVQQIRD